MRAILTPTQWQKYEYKTWYDKNLSYPKFLKAAFYSFAIFTSLLSIAIFAAKKTLTLDIS